MISTTQFNELLLTDAQAVRAELQKLTDSRQLLIVRRDTIGLNEEERNELREITQFLNSFHVKTNFRHAV